ncbi:MAG: helix-turn-helix domain-containing protein, partial [bacterium]
MKRAYKTELKVTEEQKTKIRKTIGTCRFVYNLYLDTQKTFYKETGKFMSGYDFSKWLNNKYIPENPEKIWIK